MIVVSDTTPLNYLVLVGAIDVLPRLFDDVYVPRSVLNELLNSAAPEPVRKWAGDPPQWVHVADVTSRLPSTAQLDSGEADAISLAKQIKAGVVLMDERQGRKVALREGLMVVRTIAVIELAAEKKLLELEPVLTKLAATTFRVDSALLKALMSDDAKKARETKS